MTLVLQSFGQYVELMEFDPASGFVNFYSGSTDAIQGHFLKTNNSIACLYRKDGKLIFQYDKVACEIPNGAVATLKAGGKSNVLQIVDGNTALCQWSYPKPHIDFVDTFRWVEEEDLDFGLFIRNVINDKDRRDRIYCSN